MIDTCKIKSDPIIHAATAPIEEDSEMHPAATEAITDKVSQVDPVEFKKL
jgi:hypothetical protein